MWPTDPDEFESHVKTPASQSHEDAWYFLSVDGQMVCAAEHGVPVRVVIQAALTAFG